ncbi:SRPBCC family protein [Embleya sp. MST-111070]|uniref:SRPBCC family protein n=1 Tax=Embleya sp. MST-111070 TaxID=3398231 RepID=UPI003F73D594
MAFGTIEREIHIDASPEVVFDVVSSPEHLREWWPDEAKVAAVYAEHTTGWDHYLPRLPTYAAKVGAGA